MNKLEAARIPAYMIPWKVLLTPFHPSRASLARLYDPTPYVIDRLWQVTKTYKDGSYHYYKSTIVYPSIGDEEMDSFIQAVATRMNAGQTSDNLFQVIERKIIATTESVAGYIPENPRPRPRPCLTAQEYMEGTKKPYSPVYLYRNLLDQLDQALNPESRRYLYRALESELYVLADQPTSSKYYGTRPYEVQEDHRTGTCWHKYEEVYGEAYYPATPVFSNVARGILEKICVGSSNSSIKKEIAHHFERVRREAVIQPIETSYHRFIGTTGTT